MTPAQAPEEAQFHDEYEAALAREEESRKAEVENVSAALGQRLLSQFEQRKTQRGEIEQRWLRDIRQYNGQYEPDFDAYLKERKAACKVYVPLTRRICNIVEPRLGDLLFPSDDRNFAVESSPKPELTDAQEAMTDADPAQPVNIDGTPAQMSDIQAGIAEVIDEAKRKAAAMQRTIDDQLTEADWPTQARKVIRDAVKIGSGVVKGPFVLSKTQKRWTMKGGAPTMVVVDSAIKPTIKRVDPWHFYPSLAIGELSEDPSVFERHPMNKLQFVELAEQPGFDSEAIIRVLEVGPKDQRDTNADSQRESAGTVGVDDSRYSVIEYNGPVDAQDLIDCGCKISEDEAKMLVFNGIVWFSEYTGEVIKAIINPMSAGAVMYSVYNWQPDSACVFGYGVPYEIRDLQESANSTFRAAHDNMALSVGPQVVVNSKKIVPMNGSYAIEPLKVWDLSDASVPVQNVFGFFQIDSRLNELMALFNLSKQLAEEIGGPQLAMQGQDAPNYTQTATGMSIAYNAANIWMRRAVKLWDDQVTVPRIAAFVDWNMEHNPDPDIKGDNNVVARGTSALLEAEGQVQRLQLLQQASAAAGVPIRKVINQLRQMALAMRLDPDELLPSDEEIAEMEKNQPGPAPNPEMERIKIREMEIADNAAQREHEMGIEQQRNQIRLAEIASREQLTIEEARARYGFEAAKLSRQEASADRKQEREMQMFNAELVTKARQGSGI